MNITYPSNTKEIMDDIRDVIGRDITIYTTVSGIPCSLCELDPTTGYSVDPYCSGCDGGYWTSTLSGYTVNAHVRWSQSEQPLWTSGGIIDEGDCKVTITYSEANLEIVQNADYFVVDGKELYMKHYIPKGVQELNRISIILLEDKG